MSAPSACTRDEGGAPVARACSASAHSTRRSKAASCCRAAESIALRDDAVVRAARAVFMRARTSGTAARCQGSAGGVLSWQANACWRCSITRWVGNARYSCAAWLTHVEHDKQHHVPRAAAETKSQPTQLCAHRAQSLQRHTTHLILLLRVSEASNRTLAGRKDELIWMVYARITAMLAAAS